MMRASLPELIYLFTVILAGCNAPPTAKPPPTPQTITIAITPALRPLTDKLHACAAAHPEIALFLSETPAPSLDVEKADLAFRLGAPAASPPFMAQIGWEQIVVIVNSGNPATTLSAEGLSALFAGQTARWNELGGNDDPVQVWVYPEGDDVRQVWDATLLNGAKLSSFALLAPDPQAMLEAVSDDPAAIGYLPQSWLPASEDGGVKTIRVNQKLAELLRQPVLALSAAEPHGGAARAILICLQGK